MVATTDTAQELFDSLANEALPELLDLEARHGIGLRFIVEVDVDPLKGEVRAEQAAEIEKVLKKSMPGFALLYRAQNWPPLPDRPQAMTLKIPC